jgi:hypothetical protein
MKFGNIIYCNFERRQEQMKIKVPYKASAYVFI